MAIIPPEQNGAATIGADPAILLPARKYVLAAMVGLAAVIWFLMLSGWLGVTPGSVITTRINVLFNSDTSFWVGHMINGARSDHQLIHPLEIALWRGPCLALYYLFRTVMPAEHARLVATRLFVALFAGIGVGFLALLALENGIRGMKFVLLFILYLFFTSSATLCLPEHFAISNGLLSIAFVVPFVVPNSKMRTAILAVLVVLCGGTTITNAGFPFASLFHFSIKSIRTKTILVLAGLPVAVGLFALVFSRSATVHGFTLGYLYLHGLVEPIRVLSYGFYAFVAPAVGPTPLVLRLPGWKWAMVSYESTLDPVHISYYIGIQAIGAAAWIALLLTCIYKGFQDERTRTYMWLPLGWVMFSAVFHNVWGGEMMLYAPHWSWALMGMVLLGARRLSRTSIAAMFVPIVISQIYTLHAIKSALQAIVQ
jgi:hypothetical protein